LDAYEPEFFNSQDWWGEQSPAYKVTLTIPADASYTKIYYFCHIHAGMSAEIEVVGSSASTTTKIAASALGGETEATALAIYDTIVTDHQKAIGTFDETCGTHNSSPFNVARRLSPACASSHFLCGETSTYTDCLEAVDCQMHVNMAVSVPAGVSKFATFARQMIPHHQNAVAMAKVLSKHMEAKDFPAAGTEDQDMDWAKGLVRNIINVQNFQIMQMSGWLDANPTLAKESTQCYDSATITADCSDPGEPTVAASTGKYKFGVECDKTSDTAATITLKWNEFASEWGMYTVDGCEGVGPKLKLTAGTEYTFDQSDASNWYHAVGFSYIAGGAHTECKDSAGAAGECPELGGEDGGSTLQYYVRGVAVTDDESGFGLDAYEPEFFNSQDWWGEQSPAYKVTLTIPADASYTKIYYFCHIHAGMSAEIEVVGSSASTKTEIAASALGGETEASAKAIYDTIVTDHQAAIAAYDETCGTHKSASFSPENFGSACKNMHFLCSDSALDTFHQCIEAVDCQMHMDMAVHVPDGSSKFATFARQMIPHHANAVAMAKVLSKHMTAADFPAAGTEDQDMDWAKGLVRNIINVQNFQIMQMSGWLDANPTLAGTSEACYTTMPYTHPDCSEGTNSTDGADSFAVVGALTLGLLAMDF